MKPSNLEGITSYVFLIKNVRFSILSFSWVYLWFGIATN